MKQIIKKAIAAVVCGSLLLSLAACGGNNKVKNNNNIVSKGLFLLEPNENFDLSSEEGLTEQQVYMIHIYDIIPDKEKNVDFTSVKENYRLTINNMNSYNSIESGGLSLDSFINTCRYVIPSNMKTVLAGSKQIRAMTIFIVNKNDINDDTIVNFEIFNSDIYNCKLTFNRNDIKSISYFDDIFQIENNPQEYQMISSLYTRSFDILHRLHTINWNNDVQIAATKGLLKLDISSAVSASLDSNGMAMPLVDYNGYTYNIETIKTAYPDIANDIDTMMGNVANFIELVVSANNNVPENTANQIMNSYNNATNSAFNILTYFENMDNAKSLKFEALKK